MTQNFPLLLLFVLIFFQAHHRFCNGVSVLGLSSLKNPQIDAMARGACNGKISDCFSASMEMVMDSEGNRRVLMMQKKYISYETLKKDMVPCTNPGASYYNCQAAGQANPYTRGCEVITGCARNIRDIKT
ncbi:Rapid ALkalinization Factor [Dillenia turbinata]|uniref:Rapid ALkalinization Factor n=1 Tax=Dillenia turbinata TaxID=194707 RepID=A0AAN8UKB8_9MAGN